MLELVIVVVRSLALMLRGHRELVLENVALRQQLAVMQRAQKRVPLQSCDRLFWIAFGTWLAQLAHGVDVRPARHRGAVASRLAAPPMDAAVATSTAGSSSSRSADPHLGSRDGYGESAMGAPRIHGELQTLGIDISERTVSRLIAPVSLELQMFALNQGFRNVARRRTLDLR